MFLYLQSRFFKRYRLTYREMIVNKKILLPISVLLLGNLNSVSLAATGAWTFGTDLITSPAPTTKVGIGTPTPNHWLTIKSSLTTTDYPFNVVNSLNKDVILAGKSGEDGVFYVQDRAGTAKAQIYSAGDSYLMGGKFGIGISAPTAKFDLQDASNNLTTIFNSNLTYGSGITGSYVANNLAASFGTSSTGAITGLKVTVANAGTGQSYAAIFKGGRVGIGIDLPNATLDVQGTTNLANQTVITGNTASQEALIVNQALATGAIANFRQGNASKVIIDNKGNVGIGTSTPSHGITIKSQITTTDYPLNVQNSTGADVILAGKSGEDGVFYVQDKANAPKVQIYSAGDSYLMGGKFGIGISAPTAKFDLQDASNNLSTIFNSNLNYGPGVSGSYVANNLAASFGTSSTGAITGLKVTVANAGTGQSFAAIFKGGRVGIGIDLPNATLDVQGTTNLANQTIITGNTNGQEALVVNQSQASGAIADFRTGGVSKVTIDNSGNVNFAGDLTVASVKTKVWSIAPDYVFEKDYKLASLEHVEKYLDKNKHLSEIPCAKEIKDKGLDLAEMNLKLLKKVEELTLYSIQQNKNVIAQNRIAVEQNKKIADLSERLSRVEKERK